MSSFTRSGFSSCHFCSHASADEDQSRHVVGRVGQEDDGQHEHQDGADDPVLDEGKRQDLPVPEDIRQLFVADLGQGRVHHDDQPDGDGDVGGPDAEFIPETGDLRE